jgi:hypothetical protein
MGRSVSTPRGAQVVTFDHYEDDDYEDACAWELMIECKQDRAREMWPSLRPCKEWLGCEDRAFAENRLAYIGVSEYCGVMAFWIVPKEGAGALGEHWAAQVSERFCKEFGTMAKVGHMSNGCGVYRKVG